MKRCSRFFKNRRGISNIIVTVILVGLVLVAIGVVWVVIRNIISEGTKGISLGKFTINLEIQNAYKSGNEIYAEVNRKAGSGTVLGGIFVVSNGTDKETISQNFSIEELETKTFHFGLSRININTATEVSIAPVFASTTNDRTLGDITSTYIIGVGENPGQQGTQGTMCSPACSGSTPICVNGECVSSCTSLSDCPSGTAICYDGACIPESGGCLPLCSGLTPVCFQATCVQCSSVSDCPSGTTWESCTNNICVPTACTPENPETTCISSVCGNKINNCGQQINCSNVRGGCSGSTPLCSLGQCVQCLQNSDCGANKKCASHICTEIHPLNTGIVQEVWPPSSSIYFSSSNLNTGADYKNNWISFPGSAEINCRLIFRFIPSTDLESYGKSIVEFSFETSVKQNDNYKIWESQEDCQTTLEA